MEPPPSRYRVVEEDGRLVVIDNGEPLEPLVKHSHKVVTPGKMRARANRDHARHAPVRSPRTKVGAGSTMDLPLGRDGAMKSVALSSKAMGRAAGSLFALVLLFVFAGPFLVIFLVIAALALGGTKPGDERLGKKAFRAWARWVTKA
ncbi:MAG: hypothetical protein HKN78_13450 [Sphingomonadaceae bacterium]|nr:hypothetical protein [Sphingomonadaceae bacterium]